jgi:hypothetical protein
MKLAALAAVLLLAGCRGSIPDREEPPEHGIAAILIGARMQTPNGEARDGYAVVGFETKKNLGQDAEVYRLPVRPGDALLYRVEPGIYGLAPTRSLFGSPEPGMNVRVEDRVYRVPFPRDLMRPTYEALPRKVLVIGVLETRIFPALPGRAPEVRVRLDDSADTRRDLVQHLIRDMMDPRVPPDQRNSAVSWFHPLQASLLKILAEQQQHPLFERAP